MSIGRTESESSARILTMGLACLFLVGVSELPATTQDAPTQTSRPPLILREGTKVLLNLAQQVTSKRARDGDAVELVLANDLKAGDTVVAAAGSRAIGVVIRTNEFYVRATFLEAGHTRVPLRGTLNIPDIGAQAISQTQAEIRQETQGAVFVDKDTELPWPAGTPASVSDSENKATEEAKVPEGKIRLPGGRPVRLMLMESISSKTVQTGNSVKFQVLDPVKVGDLVVIANKAPAAATIGAVHSAGMAWRSGGFEMHLDYVTLIDQQKLPLKQSTAAKGTATNAANKWGEAINESQGWALLFLPFAPLQYGHEAILAKGMVFTATTNGEAFLDRSMVEASQPKAPEPKHGNAAVTIYYPKVESPPSLTLWCGMVKLGKVRPGQRFTLSLPPGKYYFWFGPKTSLHELTALDAGEQYLKLATSAVADTRGRRSIDLAVMEHDVGEAESSDTAPAQAKNTPDVSKLDLAQLQAEPPAKMHR